MDESILRNLDTQHRRLTDLEAGLDRLLAGDTSVEIGPVPPRPRGYDELTAVNDALRAQREWTSVGLDVDFAVEFERWRSRQRLPWTFEDVLAVAVAGLIGAAATWYDSTIDAAAKAGLAKLKDTGLIRRWERDARRMPIDHMGPGFGGRAHRVRSPGHDVGRPFEALRQIRNGEFRGYRWDNGIRRLVTEDRYEPVADLGEALTLWAKHLVADFVTEMNLPLPGWTRLYELPSRQLRTFAHQAYSQGVNLRSGLLSTLPVLTTEIVVRTHVHGRAMLARGSAVLDPAETALRSELLLAGHSVVGVASLGKTLTIAMVAPPTTLAFGHVNWPVLVRAAVLALQVAADARDRRTAVRSWDDLMTDLVHDIDDALAAGPA